MATLRLTAHAVAHLEPIFEFIAERDPARALTVVQLIREAVMILERHPLIGRPAEAGRRELVMSRGRTGYVALYRWIPADETVLILAIRDARQAGHSIE